MIFGNPVEVYLRAEGCLTSVSPNRKSGDCCLSLKPQLISSVTSMTYPQAAGESAGMRLTRIFDEYQQRSILHSCLQRNQSVSEKQLPFTLAEKLAQLAGSWALYRIQQSVSLDGFFERRRPADGYVYFIYSNTHNNWNFASASRRIFCPGLKFVHLFAITQPFF